MPEHPKLAYAAAVPLVSYVALTALGVDWGSLEGAQLFAMMKHLGIVLLLVASLFFYLRFGCLATLAWCALVPFERYGALIQQFSVPPGDPSSLAVIDIVRILLLLAACLLSAALVFTVYWRPQNSGSVNADA